MKRENRDLAGTLSGVTGRSGGLTQRIHVDPEQMARLWAAAGVEEKRSGDRGTAERERMAEEGEALPEGGFPIGNRAELQKAIRALGRATNPAAAKRHIIKRARELDALDLLPASWGVTESKAAFDESKVKRGTGAQGGQFVAKGSGYSKGADGKAKDAKTVASERASVANAQRRLIELGLLSTSSGRNGGVDGLFGPKTEAALRAFQKQQGLPVTGQLDSATSAALFGKGGGKSDAAAKGKGKGKAAGSAEPGPGSGAPPVGTPPLDAPSKRVEESDVPEVNPATGAGLKEFRRGDHGQGEAIYKDGSRFDGDGWHPGPPWSPPSMTSGPASTVAASKASNVADALSQARKRGALMEDEVPEQGPNGTALLFVEPNPSGGGVYAEYEDGSTFDIGGWHPPKPVGAAGRSAVHGRTTAKSLQRKDLPVNPMDALGNHAADLADDAVAPLDLRGVDLGEPEFKYDTSPVGTPGGRQNWVDQTGGLPAFIRAIAHALIRQGKSKEQAIQIAIGQVRNWASGRGDVTPKTRAKAQAALAKWEAMKAKARATPNKKTDDLITEIKGGWDSGAPTGAALEYKDLPVESVVDVDEERGIVTAIVSVTGVRDRVGDIIEPGAYTKTLAERTPKGVWSHDWNQPISKTLEVTELLPGDPRLPQTIRGGEPWPREAGALMVKTQFNLLGDRGRQAFADVVFFGDDQEWSIGYQVPMGKSKIESKSGVRRIAELDLYEYSPVLFGAMPAAATLSVKSAQAAFKAAVTAADLVAHDDLRAFAGMETKARRFNEADVNRDNDGKFSEKPGGGAGSMAGDWQSYGSSSGGRRGPDEGVGTNVGGGPYGYTPPKATPSARPRNDYGGVDLDRYPKKTGSTNRGDYVEAVEPDGNIVQGAFGRESGQYRDTFTVTDDAGVKHEISERSRLRLVDKPGGNDKPSASPMRGGSSSPYGSWGSQDDWGGPGRGGQTDLSSQKSLEAKAGFSEASHTPDTETKAKGWARCPTCGSKAADVFANGTARCEDCGTPLTRSVGGKAVDGKAVDPRALIALKQLAATFGVDVEVKAKGAGSGRRRPGSAAPARRDEVDDAWVAEYGRQPVEDTPVPPGQDLFADTEQKSLRLDEFEVLRARRLALSAD